MKYREKQLKAIYDLVTGKGTWEGWGDGIYTKPKQGKYEDYIHDACEELEQRGLLRRVYKDNGRPNEVYWEDNTQLGSLTTALARTKV